MLGASQFMEHGQFIGSNVVYHRGRRTEDGRESFPRRKLCFGIIYAMIKMFPQWRKTAGSSNGHLLLQPNMKRVSEFTEVFFFLSLSLSSGPCVKLLGESLCFISQFSFQKESLPAFKCNLTWSKKEPFVSQCSQAIFGSDKFYFFLKFRIELFYSFNLQPKINILRAL